MVEKRWKKQLMNHQLIYEATTPTALFTAVLVAMATDRSAPSPLFLGDGGRLPWQRASPNHRQDESVGTFRRGRRGATTCRKKKRRRIFSLALLLLLFGFPFYSSLFRLRPSFYFLSSYFIYLFDLVVGFADSLPVPGWPPDRIRLRRLLRNYLPSQFLLKGGAPSSSCH